MRNVEQELRNTQALVARTYERLLDGVGEVAAMRADPEYSLAWDEPEPLISVRIATFNQAELLCERALASLRAQTYQRWEAWVIGDDCTDDTAERIAAIGDDRITFVNLPVRGPYPDEAKARWYVAGIPPMNTALARARGRWIAPLDHDDAWHPDHLEVLLAHARATRAEVAYGRLLVVDATTRAPLGDIGEWPPRRGSFGFLSAIHHAGLRAFPYDMNCRFADEPGDWNVARRMWEAGVRFSFLDRAVATAFHTQRHRSLTTEQSMIEELRVWALQVGEARDWWHQRASVIDAERDAWKAEAEAQAAHAARPVELAAAIRRLRRASASDAKAVARALARRARRTVVRPRVR